MKVVFKYVIRVSQFVDLVIGIVIAVYGLGMYVDI